MSFRLDEQTTGPELLFCYGACNKKVKMKLIDLELDDPHLTVLDNEVAPKSRLMMPKVRSGVWQSIKRFFRK
ncbi:hypothetical protein V0M98_38865 (plasmid) [Pseudomonas silesiensis]|uniref:hypothetical protein n=1 Tax=Pseudomonas silesiensis TaxID=1853130 RepID=UPI0030CBE3A7